jgi:hypothetical protein
MKRFLFALLTLAGIIIACTTKPKTYGAFPEQPGGDIAGYPAQVISIKGGDSGLLPVTPAAVTNIIDGGGVWTQELSLSGASGTMTWTIPANVAGTVSAIVSARTGTDSGVSGGSATWSCVVINHNNVCAVLSACAASQAWASTDAASTWSVALSVSSCTATVTVSGGASTTHWETVLQLAGAQ